LVKNVSFKSLDLDDFSGKFCNKNKFPLINEFKSAINEKLNDLPRNSQQAVLIDLKKSTTSTETTSTTAITATTKITTKVARTTTATTITKTTKITKITKQTSKLITKLFRRFECSKGDGYCKLN
jgi:hypothetical protein